jgi:hypothetical protein
MPNGETWEFDSAAPEQSHKQLREQLGPIIGKSLAVLRVDGTGKVMEVRSTYHSNAGRYESDLPFTITLTGADLQTGQTWTRPYRITLDPPLGAGEKFQAEQTYQVRGADGTQALIAFASTIKDPPKDPKGRLALLQMQPQGEVTFDSRLGMIIHARVQTGGVVEGHHGEGSRYEFSSEYREQLIAY